MTGRLALPRWVLNCILPGLALILLEWAAGQADAPRYVVGPGRIAASLWELAASGDLAVDTAASLWRAYAGFAIGAVCGIGIGLLSCLIAPMRAFFDPLVSLIYPVPKVALLPILITWLGFGDASKIVVIAIAVFFPTFINALYGASGVNPRLIWAARNMGARGRDIFLKVVVPASLPHIFTGLRSGLALSFVVLFAAEMVGAKNGLGNLIMRAEEGLRFDWMYAAILSIGIVGFASDRVLQYLRRRLLAGKFPGEARDA